MSSRYDDILDLPHHVSATRPQMSMADRAAQFSPFAALTGYDGEGRPTEPILSVLVWLRFMQPGPPDSVRP